MIYIILDMSYELDDIYGSSDGVIKFVSTDKDLATSTFDRLYGKPNDDDKWSYIYELWGFPDGYEYNSLNKSERPQLIKHSDNLSTED